MIILEHKPYKLGMIINLKRAPFCNRVEAYFYARYTKGFIAESATPVIRSLLTPATPVPGYLGELISSCGELFEDGDELALVGCSKAGKPNLLLGTRTDLVGELRAYFIAGFERHGGYEAAMQVARLRADRPSLRAVA